MLNQITKEISDFEKVLFHKKNLYIIYWGEGQKQSSYLWLKNGRIVYYPNGTSKNESTVVLGGDLMDERVADLLPVDYLPEKRH